MRSFLLLGFLGRLIAGQAAADPLVECGQVCELDALGRKLTFPGTVVTKTVFATTASIITYKDIKGSIIVQTSTEVAELPPVTWEVSGVTLTYPTTYAIYTDFVHSFVATQTAGGSLACATSSATLDLGASTDFASLVFPASQIVGTLPPTALVGYLESIPTVLAQLGGTVNSSCDPTAAPSTTASGPTATLSSTNTFTSLTVVTTTTSVTSEFASISDSTIIIPVTQPPFSNATTSRAPPPPPSTVTTTTITPTSTPSSTSTIASSSTTVTTNTTTLSSVTSTVTSTSFSTPSGASLTTITFTGAVSSLESSPPGNLTATATSPTNSIELSNVGIQVADVAYTSVGGWLASILGLAVYWL